MLQTYFQFKRLTSVKLPNLDITELFLNEQYCYEISASHPHNSLIYKVLINSDIALN